MNEFEAKELLDKLENWMKTTNETLKTLVSKIENQQVDIDKLKKHILRENRIIVGRN